MFLIFFCDFCHVGVLKRDAPPSPKSIWLPRFRPSSLILHPCLAVEGPRWVPAPQFVQQPSASKTSSSKLLEAPRYHCLPEERDTRSRKKNRRSEPEALSHSALAGEAELPAGRSCCSFPPPRLEVFPPGKDGEPERDGYGSIFIPNLDTC